MPEAKARARGAASTEPSSSSGVVEQLGFVPGAGVVLEHQDGDVVVVGGDAERPDQPVAHHLGRAGGAGERALQVGHPLVDVPVPSFDQAFRVEDGAGAGAQRHRARGVQPPTGAQRRAGGLGGAVHRPVGVATRMGRCPAEA